MADLNYAKGELHIIIEDAGNGNPPFIRDDKGFGIRLWSSQGKTLGINNKGEDGYLVYLSKDELLKQKAAPDMYKALKAFRPVFLARNDLLKEDELWEAVEQALAKAEGVD